MSTETPKVETPKKTIGQRLSEAVTNLNAAIASKADLQAQIQELTAAHTAAQAEIGRLTTLAGERETALNTANETIKTITGERDAARTEADTLKKTAKTVADSVTETVAQIGLPATRVPKTEEGAPPEKGAELKEYNRLMAAGNPSAAAAYYAKNREKILT